MRSTSQNHITVVAFMLLIIILLLSGCTKENKKLSAMQIETTSATVKQAEEAGARDFAPIELRLAEQKLEKARSALKNKEYDRALRLSQQSEVDAGLAEAKSRTAKAEKAVDELQQSIRTIQSEINRATKK
jgi:major membrane immunogen (membrane-anchored lipoprotein)